MASGLPDYYTRSYVDIKQQTISQLVVDIANQTLANLDVNINKQTVSELAIDIAKQTINTLGVDIEAQTVGNLAMDIAQQSVGNLAVDITNQTISDLSIDINKQTIGNLSIDIAKQTVGQLFQRPIYGAADRSWDSTTLNSMSVNTLITITGRGKLYGGNVYASSGNDHSEDMVILAIDEITLFNMSFAELMNRGLMGNPYLGLSLQRYDMVNFRWSLAIAPDITFESRVRVGYSPISSSSVTVQSEIYYALI